MVARQGFCVAFTGEHVSRIRDWAEELFREVTRQRWGTVEDIDRSTDRVWVVAASKRVTGDLAKAILRTLRHSHLLDVATVRKLRSDVDWQEYDAFLVSRGRPTKRCS